MSSEHRAQPYNNSPLGVFAGQNVGIKEVAECARRAVFPYFSNPINAVCFIAIPA